MWSVRTSLLLVAGFGLALPAQAEVPVAPPVDTSAAQPPEAPMAPHDGAPVLPQARLRDLSRQVGELIAAHGGRDTPTLVGEFDGAGELVERQELGHVASAELAHLLATVHGVFVVERARRAEVIGEAAYQQQTGQLDAAFGDLASVAGARLMVVGEVSQRGAEARVTARLLAVPSAEVLGRTEVALPLDGFVAFATDSVLLRSRAGAVFRSIVLPGWGQHYNREPQKAAAFAGGAALLGASALAFHLLGNRDLSRYEENTPDAVPYAERAEADFRRRNLSLGLLAGVWVVNVIDAYLNGPE